MLSVLLILLQQEPVQKFPPFYLPLAPGEEDKYPFLPPLVCINPFTVFSYEEVKIQVDRHIKHANYMENLDAKYPNPQIKEWLLDTTERYRRWEALEKILNPLSDEKTKREELNLLCNLLGDHDFHRGVMPMPFGYTEYP